jgi:flavin reductase (DIM6/NTAB) family NADH-FMN oxidoreductase RutF
MDFLESGGCKMEKLKLDGNVFLYPMPVVLVGAVVRGKPNFMTVGWVSRVNFKPPMIAVSVNKAHHTPKGILENRTFSVNIPVRSMLVVTDYCGLVSGRTTDKAELFQLFYGDLQTAPMIVDCPLNMECMLVEAVDLPSNHLFIGEIVGAYCGREFMTDGNPDLRKIDPIVLTMPDNQYWAVGEPLGRAWSVGKGLKKTQR